MSYPPPQGFPQPYQPPHGWQAPPPVKPPGPSLGTHFKRLFDWNVAEISITPLEVTLDPRDVATDLTQSGFFVATTPAAASNQVIGDESLADTLREHGFVAGSGAQASDFKPDGGAADTDETLLTVRLLRLGSATAATEVAAEVSARYATEELGFTAGEALPGRPESLTATVVDDKGAALHAFVPHGDFLIEIYAQQTNPSLDRLISWAGSALAKQLDLLDGFVPTPVGGLETLPVDPDGLLALTLTTKPDEHPAPSTDYAVFGPHAAVLALAPGDADAFATAGVDLASRIGPVANVFRTRDEAAADALVDKLVSTDTVIDRGSESDNGVRGTRCFHQNTDVAGEEYTCYVAADRYVAEVWSATLDDAEQRAAAQYLLLTA